jgi:hypothetical protein
MRCNRAPLVLVVSLLAAVGTAGCASKGSARAGGTQSSAPSSSTAPAAQYLGVLRANQSYPAMGVTLTTSEAADPTKTIAAAQANITWQTAVKNACVNDGGQCGTSGSLQVTLAYATDTQYGPQAPDGTVTPTMKDRLVFVLTNPTVGCPMNQAPVSPGAPSTVPNNGKPCITLNFVDALTGSLIITTTTTL